MKLYNEIYLRMKIMNCELQLARFPYQHDIDLKKLQEYLIETENYLITDANFSYVNRRYTAVYSASCNDICGKDVKRTAKLATLLLPTLIPPPNGIVGASGSKVRVKSLLAPTSIMCEQEIHFKPFHGTLAKKESKDFVLSEIPKFSSKMKGPLLAIQHYFLWRKGKGFPILEVNEVLPFSSLSLWWKIIES
jgi:hypothetical protein